MGPIAKRRIAVRSGEARWKERVKTWPNKSLAESSDSASTDDSSWEPSEDGSYRRSKRSFPEDDEVKPKQEELSDELSSAGTVPPSRAPSPHEDEDTAELVKSKVSYEQFIASIHSFKVCSWFYESSYKIMWLSEVWTGVVMAHFKLRGIGG